MLLPLFALKGDSARLGIQPGENVELVTAEYLAAHGDEVPEVYLYVFDTPAQASAAQLVMADQGDESLPSLACRASNGEGVLVLAMLNSDSRGEIIIHDHRRHRSTDIDGSWQNDSGAWESKLLSDKGIDTEARSLAFAEIFAESAFPSARREDITRLEDRFLGVMLGETVADAEPEV